ncbi:MAG: hypothetical protein M1823_004870 [Watsoniomyces obsoletus]|nr:MAG: hypothetical protein M1823_004870 [Watsoniomyces obsoletus]
MCYPKPLDQLPGILMDGYTQCLGSKQDGDQCTNTSSRNSARFKKAAVAIKATLNLDVNDPKNLPRFMDLAGTLLCGHHTKATSRYPPQTWILIAEWAPHSKHGRIMQRGIREYHGPAKIESNPAACFLASGIESLVKERTTCRTSAERTATAHPIKVDRVGSDDAGPARAGRGRTEERTSRNQSHSQSTEHERGLKTPVKQEDGSLEDHLPTSPSKVKLERRSSSCPDTGRSARRAPVKHERKTENDGPKLESQPSTRKKLAFDLAKTTRVAVPIKSLKSEDVQRFPGRMITRSMARTEGTYLYYLADEVASPFTNYRTKNRSEEEVDQSLCTKLRKPFTPREEKSGYVYIYRRPDFPGHVKIGITTRTIDQRLKEIARQCGFDLELISEIQQRRIPNVYRAEALIHANLALSRKWEQCSGCGKRHKECFEISEDMAIAVVEYWRTFIEAMPYMKDGSSLKPKWIDYLDRLESHWNSRSKEDGGHEQWAESGMDRKGKVKVEPLSD